MAYVKQLQLGPMKNFVYLVGPADGSEVTVIDPAWDVDAIRKAAAADGKTITSAIVSHCHGDHTNGIPELLRGGDLPVYANEKEVAFSEELRRMGGDALRPSKPGDTVQVGNLQLKLLHTPGHTPGSQCVHTGEAVVSGDTVFVNACGRCDLKGGNPDDMYRSINQVLLALPETTTLLPGHDYGDVPVSSLGREKAQNPYFQFHDLTEFVTFRMRPRK
ncbi:MAG: MBL fold metallo-hydrolase [Myxococcaceae bacterium]